MIKKQQVRVSAVLVLLALVSVSPIMAQPQDLQDVSKIFRVHVGFTPSGILPAAVTLEYGYGPALQSAPGDYTGRVLASDGAVVEEFAISDPRIWRGEEAAVDKDGRLVYFNGLSEEKERADTDIIFPFHARAGRFRIIEPGSGPAKADIDLVPAVTAFCRTHPYDPDCSFRSPGPEGELPVPGFGAAAVFALVVIIGLYEKLSRS